MSVEETASPHDSKLNELSDELEPIKDQIYPAKENDKENVGSDDESKEMTSNVKRAHSLSPKVSRRIFPSALSPVIIPSSDENLAAKPKRSSLRSKQPGDQRSDKHVKISPHSSADSFTSSDNSLGQNTRGSPLKTPEHKKRISQTERPKSMEDLEKHTFTVSGFPGDLQTNLIRRGSTRSERLDYSDVECFLENKLIERTGSSTPELLETYENQLSHLKKDLESKVRMLTMYETSMADLSSKVVTLKRTLEEKDAAIKHLTDEKVRWHDYDTHSLAPSRMTTCDISGLSDGAHSDSERTEIEKESETKSTKKPKWMKRFMKKNAKKEQDMNQMEVASLASLAIDIPPNAVANRSIKRTHTIGGGSIRNKPSDLISISEYSTAPDTRTVKDFDVKSLDAHSEFGAGLIQGMDELMTVYKEDGPGLDIIVELLMDDIQSSHDDSVKTMPLGSINVHEDCSWIMLDSKISDAFIHHIFSIDPEQSLHLTEESILYYMVDDVQRSIGNALLPFVTPYQAVSNDTRITIALKGTGQESCDALAYKYLINVEVLHSYIAMLLETQWLVVMGTKGTCKTSLAEGLVSYLELFVGEGMEDEDDLVIDDGDKQLVRRFSISSAPGIPGSGIEAAMKYIRHDMPRLSERSTMPILFFDNIYDCQSLEQLFSAAGMLPKRPYIVSTLCSGSTRGIPLHQLMFRHNIRVVTCSPSNDPILGILSRTLRKQVYHMKADPESDIEPVAEQLINWLPYLLDHINYFINKFHSNNVALGNERDLNDWSIIIPTL
jgi:hypothetical protein